MARQRKDVVVYDKNPFLEKVADLKTRKKRVSVHAGKAIVDTTTGELESVAEVCAVQYVDKEQFVKLYTGGLKQFFSLTPATYRIVQVVLHETGALPRGDQVYLDISKVKAYMEKTDQKPVSRPTYHKAIKELIQKGFIAETPSQNLYWLNIGLFFNGDRFRFVKEYRLKDSEQESLLPPADEQKVLSARDPFQFDLEDFTGRPTQPDED